MRYSSLTSRLHGLGSDKWAVHVAGRRRAYAGEQLIFLSIGEPDVAPPAAVVDHAVERLRAGRTGYAFAGRGEPAALQAIAGYYARRTGRAITPDQVVFTAGTQNALYGAVSCLAEAGDEVLVPDPYYATYEGVVAATGATMVPVPTRPDDAFHLTADELARAVTPRSRVLMLTTPSNPTGAVLSAAEIAAIGEVCIAHDIAVVCDEVYADLTYGPPDGPLFASPFDNPALADRAVSVASISKSHALPGFRCGWAVGSAEFATRLVTLSETMLFGSQPFLADATALALNEPLAEVGEWRTLCRSRAAAVVTAFDGDPLVGARMPEGGMFMMLDVRRSGLSGVAFATRLLAEHDVVTMPGESFGSSAAGHLRVALTVDEDRLVEACRRISKLAAQVATERR